MKKSDDKPARKKKLSTEQWESVRLTPLEEWDIDLLHSWLNSPSVRDLAMGGRLPMQRESIRDWLRSVRDQNGGWRIVHGIRVGAELVGMSEIHAIQHYQRKALLGIYIGDPERRNRGVGYIASALTLDYVFNGMDLRKVNLEVLSTNRNAVQLYKKLGFVHEGTKRQDYAMGGRYLDTLLFGMLREEFTIDMPSQANRLIYPA